MNTESYCRDVERKERLHKELISTIRIQDDHSPLISLKDLGFNLMFEPSMMKGYEYRAREAVCEKIGRISRRLTEQDKVLIIRSVWRSFAHQTQLWATKVAVMRKKFPRKDLKDIKETVSYFVASPKKSMHATGGAVDALIYDSQTDRVLDFGNNEGLTLELDETAYPYHPDISPEAKRNRQLLIQLFEKEDFVVDLREYWHFDYGNASWATQKGTECARYDVIEELV
jgi:D-alanyl-D-alanine dipeptidase